nr:DUF4034 domain-containing protein [Achromobacter insuavis]
MYSPSAVRSHSRALVQARAFPRIDAYYADLEQQDWSLPASQISAYSEAVLSGTLFDYSTVPYPQAADFLQAWIAACPDSYHAHLVLGNFCFGRAADIRGFGWADSVTQDRWIGAALACETAAAALLKAMTLSPRPVAACVTMMQMRDADGTATQRDPLDRPVGRAERFSGIGGNAGGANPSPGLRIVPAARFAAGRTRRGARSVREFRQLFAGRPRACPCAARAERGGVPGEYVFWRSGRAIPQFRARDADSPHSGRRRRVQARAGTHERLGPVGDPAGVGGGGASVRAVGV